MSDKFGVSIRTIYRDIRKLEEAGVPVITVEGMGYSLMDGYTVAPVQFSQKEANALITAEHLVKQTQDQSLLENFDEALTKIKSVFRSNVLSKSEELSSKIHVFDTSRERIASNALSEIQLAITNFNLTEINYRKADDPEITFRTIEPYGIYSSFSKWILIAWCHLRDDYHAFRIDRIQHFKILDQTFENRGFNMQEYFLSGPFEPNFTQNPEPKKPDL